MAEEQMYYDYLYNLWEWSEIPHAQFAAELGAEFPELTKQEAKEIVEKWWQAKKEWARYDSRH